MILTKHDVECAIKHILKYYDVDVVDSKIRFHDKIELFLRGRYKNMDVSMELEANVYQKAKETIFDLMGTIYYGFLEFDVMKLLKQYTPSKPYLNIDQDHIILKNPYISSIHIESNRIEIELA